MSKQNGLHVQQQLHNDPNGNATLNSRKNSTGISAPPSAPSTLKELVA